MKADKEHLEGQSEEEPVSNSHQLEAMTVDLANMQQMQILLQQSIDSRTNSIAGTQQLEAELLRTKKKELCAKENKCSAIAKELEASTKKVEATKTSNRQLKADFDSANSHRKQLIDNIIDLKKKQKEADETFGSHRDMSNYAASERLTHDCLMNTYLEIRSNRTPFPTEAVEVAQALAAPIQQAQRPPAITVPPAGSPTGKSPKKRKSKDEGQ